MEVDFETTARLTFQMESIERNRRCPRTSSPKMAFLRCKLAVDRLVVEYNCIKFTTKAQLVAFERGKERC